MTQEPMSTGRAFFVIGMALMGAQAVHWLMTPLNHPDASALRTAAVVVQLFVGFGAALWFGKSRLIGRQ